MYEIRLNKNQGTIHLRKIQKNITLVQVGRRGEQGDPGTPGAPGQGVPVGGTTGQVLAKDSNVDYDTEWIDIPSAPVSSVFGRTGAVVAAAGDYTGSQVNNVPSGGIAATTVQAALNELDTEKASDSSVVHITGSELVTGLKTFDSGLLVSAFAELISGMGIDGSDGVGGAALRLVSYDGEILIDAPGEIRLRTDGGTPRLIANGVSIDVTGLKITSVADPETSADAANKGYVDAQIAIVEGGDVDSFNGRTGVVVPVSGDYTAAMITNTPSGGIAGVTVQTALNELDTEKANDSNVVHITGTETVTGEKNFSPANSTTAFRVRNAAMTTTTLGVDTSNNRILIGGGGLPQSTLHVNGLSRFSNEVATAATARVDIQGGTTGNAPFRIRSGVAPTSPNDGDIWYDGTDLRWRQSSTTNIIAKDASVVHLAGTETITGAKTFNLPPTYSQTTAPTAATNTAVQWVASGAGTKDGQAYDQGDVLLTSDVGGVSKTLLVLDWSAI